ncbi:MAG: glycosyltransferase family 4 protein [Gammaproteobacteria bacterium]
MTSLRLDEMPALSNATLTLVFTGGVQLKTWAQIGSLSREVQIYQRLVPHLKRINFVTYGGKQDEAYADKLGDISVLPSLWTPSPAFNRLTLWQNYAEALRQSDVIKTHQIPGSDIAVWLKQRCQCRLVTRCGYLWSLNAERESHDAEAIHRVRELERIAFAEADIGVMTTKANLRHVVEQHHIEPRKLRIVPNYVDVNRFSPRPFNSTKHPIPTLMFVGRLSAEKNVEGTLDALGILQARVHTVPKLAIVGEGQLKQALLVKASKLGLPVSFLGSVPNEQLPGLLRSADVFILPSLYEGHPKALLEAMSCGLPCIGADVEGIRQEIRHGDNGYLCRTSPESIANAIETVINDTVLQVELGKRARQYVVENYALEKVLQQELAVLEDALQG